MYGALVQKLSIYSSNLRYYIKFSTWHENYMIAIYGCINTIGIATVVKPLFAPDCNVLDFDLVGH
jgi:hypothetical protein